MLPGWKKYFDPKTLADLSGLGLRRSQIFDGGPLAGAHHSPRHGHSVEFADHRPYVPGDDVRSVDWKIFARTDRYFLRNREDETTLICYLLVDASGSMDFAAIDPSSGATTKFDYACLAAAALGFITLENQDRCSLRLLGGTGYDLPIAGGAPQLEAMAEAFSRSRPGGDTRIGAAVRQVLPQLDRPGVVVLVSDLLDEPESIDNAVAQLRAAGHDLLVLQVLAPEERGLTLTGTTRFEGAEGEPAIELQVEAFAQAYQQALHAFTDQLVQCCQRHGSHFLGLTVGEPLGKRLAAALHQYYGG